MKCALFFALFMALLFMTGPAPAKETSDEVRYIRELANLREHGKLLLPYSYKMLDRLKARDFKYLDHYYTTLQTAYEEGRIDDIQLDYAYSLIQYNPYAFGNKKIKNADELFAAWAKQIPNSYPARYLNVVYHVQHGWELRGSDLAQNTTREQFEGMKQEFIKARQENIEAAKLTPKPTLNLNQDMIMAVSSGGTIKDVYDQMSSIITQSEVVDPDNLTVRMTFMRNIQPRWFGSNEIMQAYVKYMRAQKGLSKEKVGFLEGIMYADIGDQLYKQDGHEAQALAYLRKAAMLQKPFLGYAYGHGNWISYIGAMNYIQQQATNSMPLDKEFSNALDIFIGDDRFPPDGGIIFSQRARLRNIMQDYKGAWSDYQEAANYYHDSYALYDVGYMYCIPTSQLAQSAGIKQDIKKCVAMLEESSHYNPEMQKSVDSTLLWVAQQQQGQTEIARQNQKDLQETIRLQNPDEVRKDEEAQTTKRQSDFKLLWDKYKSGGLKDNDGPGLLDIASVYCNGNNPERQGYDYPDYNKCMDFLNRAKKAGPDIVIQGADAQLKQVNEMRKIVPGYFDRKNWEQVMAKAPSREMTTEQIAKYNASIRTYSPPSDEFDKIWSEFKKGKHQNEGNILFSIGIVYCGERDVYRKYAPLDLKKCQSLMERAVKAGPDAITEAAQGQISYIKNQMDFAESQKPENSPQVKFKKTWADYKAGKLPEKGLDIVQLAMVFCTEDQSTAFYKGYDEYDYDKCVDLLDHAIKANDPNSNVEGTISWLETIKKKHAQGLDRPAAR